MIRERLESIREIKYLHYINSSEETYSQMNKLHNRIENQSAYPIDKVRHFNGRDVDPSEISSWISKQGLACELVRVIWLYDHESVTMSLNTFLKNFCELWNPSSDDLAVFNLSFTYIILISHEEDVKLYLLNQNDILSDLERPHVDQDFRTQEFPP